jgi:sugar (Glycoside-Pentoside-Hexuronide) transporter
MKEFLRALPHKVFGTTPQSDLQPKEAMSYSIAGFGQNLICALVGNYLVYYMTNGLLIDAMAVGFIMLGVRVFDACADPVMGSIVDRTRTRWGKCRPYLLFTPVPIAIMTTLVFLPLPVSVSSTIATATIIYVVWSLTYTIVDVPYWGLASSMSSNTNVRANMLTVARIACTLGGGLIAIIVPSLSSSWIKPFLDASGNIAPGSELAAANALRHNYVWLALITGVVAVPTFIIGFLNSRERFYNAEKPKSLMHNLGLIFKNKPLVLIIISGVLGAGKMLYMYSGLYFAQYNLGFTHTSFLGMEGAALFTIITFAIVPGGLVASVLTPYCSRRFGKKNTYIYSHIFGAAALFMMYFVGWDAPWKLIVNLIGLIITGIPGGFGNIITYAMIADSIDYLEWKTGERGEGVCFAMQTFINKIGMAAGAAITCFGLGWAGIKADDMTSVTKGGLDTLFLVSVLIPAVSMLLSALPLFFYKFDEKEQARVVKIIEERKLAINN